MSRRYSSWGYLERDDDLLVRRGVLVKRLSVVPYGRMHFVDVTAGPSSACSELQLCGFTRQLRQQMPDCRVSASQRQLGCGSS